MKSLTASHRHVEPSSGIRGSGRGWIGMIIGLLLLNASIVAATVFFAVRDESAATEPDYYAKALAHEETIRLRTAARDLGWIVRSEIRPVVGGGGMELVVGLTDRVQNPIDGALLQAEVFAHVRSGQRQELALSPAGGNGKYAAPIRIDRSGLWRVVLKIRRDGEACIHEIDLMIPER